MVLGDAVTQRLSIVRNNVNHCNHFTLYYGRRLNSDYSYLLIILSAATLRTDHLTEGGR